jgi:hypothetical protein
MSGCANRRGRSFLAISSQYSAFRQTIYRNGREGCKVGYLVLGIWLDWNPSPLFLKATKRRWSQTQKPSSFALFAPFAVKRVWLNVDCQLLMLQIGNRSMYLQ